MSSPKRRLRRALQREVDEQASGQFIELGNSGLHVPEGSELRVLELVASVGTQAQDQLVKAMKAGADATEIGIRAMKMADSAARCSTGPALWQCKKGCNACCHDRVFVTPPEALLIARGIRECHPGDAVPELLEALRAKAALLSDPTLQQGSIRVPCLFLDPEGACAAYEVRPIVCRSFASFDVESCRRHYDDPSFAVTQDTAAMIAGGAVSAALRKTATDAALDGELYELHAAVLAALLDPNAGDRWHRGERIFDGCLRLGALAETPS